MSSQVQMIERTNKLLVALVEKVYILHKVPELECDIEGTTIIHALLEKMGIFEDAKRWEEALPEDEARKIIELKSAIVAPTSQTSSGSASPQQMQQEDGSRAPQPGDGLLHQSPLVHLQAPVTQIRADQYDPSLVPNGCYPHPGQAEGIYQHAYTPSLHSSSSGHSLISQVLAYSQASSAQAQDIQVYGIETGNPSFPGTADNMQREQVQTGQHRREQSQQQPEPQQALQHYLQQQQQQQPAAQAQSQEIAYATNEPQMPALYATSVPSPIAPALSLPQYSMVPAMEQSPNAYIPAPTPWTDYNGYAMDMEDFDNVNTDDYNDYDFLGDTMPLNHE